MTWKAWPSAGWTSGLDHVEELGERTRPAVGEQQRRGVGPVGPDVQEMDALAVDLGDELRIAVEQCLLGAPVVPRAPVVGEVLQVVHRDPAAPAGRRAVARASGRVEPVMQVVHVGLRDVDEEGVDARRSSRLLLAGDRELPVDLGLSTPTTLETIAARSFPRLFGE